MEPPWLDSLPEDWVSQPRSSSSPAPSLPSPTDTTSNSSSAPPPASRIPKYNLQKKKWTAGPGGTNSPLSERSLNENNVPLSFRAKQPSKLRDDIFNRTEDGSVQHRRSMSDSISHSSQCHTIQHRPDSTSPDKKSKETPEWRRRILNRDLAYGEQCDLFSPAGLENIFRPPTSPNLPPSKLQAFTSGPSSVIMPSSPPPYASKRIPHTEKGTFDDGQASAKEKKSRKPQEVQYRLADEGPSNFSINDLSQGSSFQPQQSESSDGRSGGDSTTAPSSLEPHTIPQAGLMNMAGRTFSGQSDVRNEELSPIYISRQNTIGGSMDFVADLPAPSLQQRLQDFREDTPVEDTVDDQSSQLVLDDITADTDDFAHNGKFVNFRRGGRSHEGSFQKRMLSPSSLPAIDEPAILPEESAMLLEESMQASTPKKLPHILRTRPTDKNENKTHQVKEVLSPIPHTPHTSPGKSSNKEKDLTSGSPLKLFGTYDTFTNQKLLRRLSQFEEEGSDDEKSPIAPVQESTHSELNDFFVSASVPMKKTGSRKSLQTRSRNLSSFGEGDLDDFQFSEEISYHSRQVQRDDDSEESSLLLQTQGQKTDVKFQLEPSPALETNSIISRRTKYSNTSSSTKQTIRIRKSRSSSSLQAPPSQTIENLETPRKRNGDSEGKRLPRSPFKDPTPKRRRTLQEADFEETSQDELDAGLDSLRETHHQMQSVIGKKRKDARHDDDQQAANPKVLAMRQILRPRTPTPSQKLNREKNQSSGSRQSLAERARIQEEKIARIQAELDATETPPPLKALGASQHLLDGSRKGSVTTQDFLDEAKKIMGHIRDKAGARSGLTSVEESESENDRARSPGELADGEPLEDSYQESTQEPFSRPPSREGPPLQRLPIKQVDPDLLNHLRKYQEMSDMDGVIASSIRSIALAKEATEAIREVDRITAEARSKLTRHGGIEETIESEPPNIRISENPDIHRKRKHSSSTASHNTGGLEADFPSHDSNSSSGQSTTHSIPTGSSRGSDSRRVIAPHTVSHLIPEQLAGMVFDRDRNIWIKRKTASGESGKLNFLPSDETEDDPFGDIPDLSVDETQELQRIKLVATRLKQNVMIPDEQDLGSLQKFAQEKPTQPSEQVSEDLLPPILGQSSLLEDAESIYELPESQPIPKETPFTKKITKVTNEESKIEEVFEKEISIHEDRVSSDTPLRRRHVTISFSSPLTSVIPPTPDRDTSSILNMEKDDDEINQSESESFMIAERKDKRQVSIKARSTTRKSSRRGSLGRHAFSTRPVSRIEERDEDVTENNDGTQDRSISIIVATPTVSMRTTSIVLATPRPAHEIGTLTLSPMSDFTIHQNDEPLGLNVSYVARNHRYSHGSESQRALSLTIKTLVEKITEVEPYEPFWEHMKEIDLTDKKLTNLHKLDEFCAQLEEVDASNNRISQLDGLSRSVRNLRISHNCLTDLTAWGHLSNLQYIDVSNNELESLSAFKSLVHLRGIRADNNLITSISGVDQLDGLLSLRLRGNRVASVDLRGTRLQRLTELDLRNNQLSCLRNLCELSSLTDLDVEDNELENFCTDIDEANTTLKSLRLSGNNLEHIDVSLYPNLRLIYLDRNRLGSITGLYKTKHLDSLSLREQKSPISLDFGFLSDAYEIRKLFLSGNLIHSLQFKFDFLNLQYLELANCGLETLQPNLGQMICNTRVLNLNYNALADITPLTGIVRLKKLHLAGNRLANIKRTATSLSQLNGLTLVDLRANPMTQGFYPPVTESSVALNTAKGITETIEPYTMTKADTGKDMKYTRCLDLKTKMLRRVYEMMVLGGCRRVKMLDGLVNDRSSVKAKDEVWDALIAGGFISLPGANNQAENTRPGCVKVQGPRREGSHQGDTLPPQQRSTVLGTVQEEEQESTLKPAEKSIFEERWCAEDSFA